MSDGFDRLSRTMARPNRRTLLKSIGAAAVVAVARPFRSSADCPSGQTPCGPTCCAAGVACANKRKGICACSAGQVACGGSCCPSGTCSDPDSGCCCATGTTPCGPTCCQGGVGCVNARKGVCGCPSNTVQCTKNGVTHCCPSGSSCSQFASCPPSTAVGCSCQRYAEQCTGDGDCCSGFCSSAKSGYCGCTNDAQCEAGQTCQTITGICS